MNRRNFRRRGYKHYHNPDLKLGQVFDELYKDIEPELGPSPMWSLFVSYLLGVATVLVAIWVLFDPLLHP